MTLLFQADKVCEDKEIEVIVKVEPDCNKLGYCVPKPVKETKTVPGNLNTSSYTSVYQNFHDNFPSQIP